jgi:hypothetical protein
MLRRCWKHSRQYTGRPCVGLNGTVVSLPHCEQMVLVSTRCTPGEDEPAPPWARFALQALHRLGSFLNPLSAKNICSPAVKTNSAPHSLHFRTLSWYSIGRSGTVLGDRTGSGIARILDLLRRAGEILFPGMSHRVSKFRPFGWAKPEAQEEGARQGRLRLPPAGWQYAAGKRPSNSVA